MEWSGPGTNFSLFYTEYHFAKLTQSLERFLQIYILEIALKMELASRQIKLDPAELSPHLSPYNFLYAKPTPII
jgi:hypothetical protein